MPAVHSAGDSLSGGLHECRGIKACEGLCWWVVFTSGPVVLGGGSTQAQTRGALTCSMSFLDLH